MALSDTLSAESISKLTKLKDDLSGILKCHYCKNILTDVRTLNCPHHVCAVCADKQSLSSSNCDICDCSYYKKDIKHNICIGNIVETFHGLASTIDRAAELCNVKHKNTMLGKKRKRNPKKSETPNAKKRKLSSPELQIKVICVTGYDTEQYEKFESFAQSLGIAVSKKWSTNSTNVLISKHHMADNRPVASFKVLASILCGIPVIKEEFLEDSYQRRQILDYRDYLLNYRRVKALSEDGLFGGLDILFAETKMKQKRLQNILSLGGANILKTKEEVHGGHSENERIMICTNEIERDEAIELAQKYNCRVIGESWLVHCINPNQDGDGVSLCLTKKSDMIDYYAMEPIVERIGFENYDQTQKDDESDDDYDDDFY